MCNVAIVVDVTSGLSQVKDQVPLQTRVKVVDSTPAQAIPLQAIGPRPGNLKDANLADAEDPAVAKPKQQSFLRKYVSVCVWWHFLSASFDG